MPKMKPNKGLKKRIKLTKTGKIKRAKAGRGHLMTSKNGKRVRRLRKGGEVSGVEMQKIKRMLAVG